MEYWFSEYHTKDVKLSIRANEQLFSGKSDYQTFDVFSTPEFGKMLVSDGEIVFTESDEFVYDEMVTHVPMAVHPNVKKVLIFGGGDGGVATTFTQYPEIERNGTTVVDLEITVHSVRRLLAIDGDEAQISQSLAGTQIVEDDDRLIDVLDVEATCYRKWFGRSDVVIHILVQHNGLRHLLHHSLGVHGKSACHQQG